MYVCMIETGQRILALAAAFMTTAARLQGSQATAVLDIASNKI
jgi:hypothetical protein